MCPGYKQIATDVKVLDFGVPLNIKFPVKRESVLNHGPKKP